jgi:hypothetical protein
MVYKNHIERLREQVHRALSRGCTEQNFIKQLTIDEAMCLIGDYDLLLGEVKSYREHFASLRRTDVLDKDKAQSACG